MKKNTEPVKNEEVSPASSSSVGTFALKEERILDGWRTKNIFKKTLEKDAPKGKYVFYDGPPFATGLPHYGHIVPGTIKDVIPRYKTMCGFQVARRWGWDCHGLPVENLVEKELGLKTKKDIEDLGIEKFNAAAATSVMRFADDWRTIVPRLGRFVDMEDDYRTMDAPYTESVWWAFKTLFKKGLIYEGRKPMHVCPRCETTLSNFEVAQGYQDIKDISAYVKFRVPEGQKIGAWVVPKDTFILAWTTTPWTLPGNVALAVNPAVAYVSFKVSDGDHTGQTFIVAANKASSLLKNSVPASDNAGEGNSVGAGEQQFSGDSLVGLFYEPLFPYYAHDTKLENHERGWKVYAADFVTTEDGTGVVHIAPAFGEDDLVLGQKERLPFVQHVGMDGRFKDEVKDFAGESVKPKGHHTDTDKKVNEYLQAHGLLFKDEVLTHSYPHCWRCETPLLNYAASSWFVAVSTMRDDLVAQNSEVVWVPQEIRDGRFGKWLQGARDWAISRSRYWGAPIPVWRCEACSKSEVIGSVADLVAHLPPRNRFMVMRHGEAENNVADIVSSHVDTLHHLTKEGIAQVKKAAEKLAGTHIDYIISSPLVRTKETAEIIHKELGIKNELIIDKRLREVGGGTFDGKSFTEYHAYFEEHGDRFDTRPPEGECYADVRTRAMEALYEFDATYEGKTILLVTHESPAWLLVAGSLGLDRKQAVALRADGDDGWSFIKNADYQEISFSRLPKNSFGEIDMHRPYIDEIVFPCTCGGLMRRLPDVFDCWFESGAMPFASQHYLGVATEAFDPESNIGFPADLIAEGLDQTRGWFYSMLVLSMALFGRAPYKSVIVNGLVLAENGQKMSKRLKNYPDVMEVVNKYGADALRLYLLGSPVVHAEDVRFSERGVDEIMKKTLLRLDNVLSFYALYAQEPVAGQLQEPEGEHILDHWVRSLLHEVVREVTDALERGELDRAVRPLHAFVDDLSTWYVRRSRERFKGDNLADRAEALATLRYVLVQFSKLLAPFAPFYADHLYLSVLGEHGKESVHLESWPAPQQLSAGQKLLVTEMADARTIVSLALEARARAGIKVRQPLSSLTVRRKAGTLAPALLSVIALEVNVKSVVIDPKAEAEVTLDCVLTPALQAEGQMRELVRAIQEVRKQGGLQQKDIVSLSVDTTAEGRSLLERFGQEVFKVAGIDSFVWEPVVAQTDAVVVGGHSFVFAVKRA